MKKYILFLFLTALLITNSSTALASSIYIGNLSGESGSVIDAMVQLNTTKSYGTGTIIVTYDPDILEVTDVTDGESSTIVAKKFDNSMALSGYLHGI